MKKRMISTALCALLGASFLADAVPAHAAQAPAAIPAFPGAEGGGMYASGGRGYDVYEVTNLNDSGPGSLREAISGDNRMVVFRVSGTIHLASSLGFTNRKNITVAGQTAPGDGICIAGFNTDISSATNIIIRYLRFRPGSANISSEPDALGGRGSNYVMIDHVSAGWSTDEGLSFYENNNLTVQWSIISESLTLSGHVKGKHGYGGIWGGNATTFHHNLLTSHTSRMPRIGNGNTPGNITMSNNVIYNWGFNNTYGGLTTLQSNVINNYYKPGPSTLQSVKGRIINPGDGEFFVDGNYMYGSPEISADNSKGIQNAIPATVLSKTPFQNDSYTTVKITDAEQAYQDVLDMAGAVLPRRDAADARAVQDVIDGTGRTINREYEVGGYPELQSAEAPLDSDHDGMPDAWEEANGLNKLDKADGKTISPNGYSNLENYLNSLADMTHAADNPVVKLKSPVYNALFTEGGAIRIDAEAEDRDGIAKVQFYRNDVLVGEVKKAPYSFTLDNVEDGTYFISARAFDTKGNATQSTSLPVHVNGPGVSTGWTSADIGNTPVKGSGSLDGSGTLTVKGSGKITGRSDSFHYVYQPVSGNASLTARLDSIALLDNNAISGLMIRDSLEPDAVAALISTSIVKADRDELGNGDKDDTFYATYFSSRMNKGETIRTLNNADYPQDYLPSLTDNTLPIWLKLERVEDTIAAFTSYDGEHWKELFRDTFAMDKEAYIGFAVDGTQPAIGDKYYNTAKFSNVQLSSSFTVTDIKLTDALGNEAAQPAPGLTAVAAVTVERNSIAVPEGVVVIQLCDAEGNILSSSYVKSAFGVNGTKTVKAMFSTPLQLTGLQIKAYVINNVQEGQLISNEKSVQLGGGL
ncbi:Ig-like domain-containing protein [Paenibacillus sp. FSL R7-0273]|uniref:Ig-like domain-containing protein n=1 Tax=Paenibacillus sp. FSL R7-0273 TaxID=1536772 RepID=UPI0007C7D067|nr:Ig-like domain-containing protein [Paenibacillus sp. FSL R7-0273]OMF95337.1 hypothetical protein BK144_07415 [Paenibacillus sp. FSL R7-0273]